MRLFEFLARSQQLKSRPPQSVDSYESVLWFGDLPEHSAVTSSHHDADPESGRELLAVERVPPQPPPESEPALRPWIAGAWDDVAAPPRLRESVDTGELLTVLDELKTRYNRRNDTAHDHASHAEHPDRRRSRRRPTSGTRQAIRRRCPTSVHMIIGRGALFTAVGYRNAAW